jgi:hypothetical protein
MVADDIDQRHAHAVFVGLRRGFDERLDDDDDRWRRRRLDVVGQLADATGDQHSDVRLGAIQARRCGRFADVGGELVVGKRDVERDHGRRRTEPAHVPIVEKRPAVVGAQRLVNALAVQESVVEHRDDRVTLVGDPSVYVDRRCHK